MLPALLQQHGFNVSFASMQIMAHRNIGLKYSKWRHRLSYLLDDLLHWERNRYTPTYSSTAEHRRAAEQAKTA